MATIPKDLKEWKKQRGLNNKDIAGLFNVTPIYVSYLLNGKKRPSGDLAVRINRITDIPLQVLLTGK